MEIPVKGEGSLRSVEMMRTARMIVEQCVALRPGEHVAVIGDTETAPIAEVLAQAGHAAGGETVVCIMTPREQHGNDPPPVIAAAMQAADVMLMALTHSVTHTRARKATSARGEHPQYAGSIHSTGGSEPVQFWLAHVLNGVSIGKAREWGLYISTSRSVTSAGVEEPPLFAEPGLFLVKPDGTLYWGNISTMPFARPHFPKIAQAIDFALAKSYPARGEA